MSSSVLREGKGHSRNFRDIASLILAVWSSAMKSSMVLSTLSNRPILK